MKAFLSFISGGLFGAVAMFLFLHQYPVDNEAQQVASAPAANGLPTQPATPAAPPPAATQSAQPLAASPGAAQLPAPGAVPQQDVPAPGASEAIEAQLGSGQVQTSGSSGGGAAEGAQASGKVPPGLEDLLVPVEGVTAAQLKDTFNEARGQGRHEAMDILAPKGTRVFAVADGKVVKLFNSKPGGLTVYQFDPGANYAFYYAHLDRYAKGLKEGMVLKRGDLVGYVGNTGNADPATPHLHFTIFELTPEKQWWKGTPVNPYPLLTGEGKKSGAGGP